MRTSRLKRIMSFGMALVLTVSLVSAPLTVSAAEEPGGAPVTEATPPPGETQAVDTSEPPEESEVAGPTGNPTPEPKPTAETTPEPSAEPTPTPDTTTTPEPTPDATPEPSVAPDPIPTDTPMPEETPIPTETPLPTETPAPELDMELLALLAASGTYNINTATVALTSPGDYTIAGTGVATNNTITISGPGEYTVTINNVNIDCSAQPNTCAFSIMGGAVVHLILSGNNELYSGENCAGIQVPEGCAITVEGSGALTVTGGAGQYNAAAGIGGGVHMVNGPITINGGTITANGGDKSYNGAAGIGGGCGAGGQDITINGGNVTANGSAESYNGASGIGGGAEGGATRITINGGSVTTTASKDSFLGAAGLGGGYLGSADHLTFTGGTVDAKSSFGSNTNGAGIGGGYGGTASYIDISGTAKIKANVNHVNATFDGSNGAGIGGGGAFVEKNGTIGAGGHADHITISGGTIQAYGNSQAAGIGGGAHGNATDIEITGGQVWAYGGYTPASNSYIGGAGIGGGSYGYAEDITIQTGQKDTCTLWAYNGYGSAGIGGGCHGYAKNITIRDSNIYASGNYRGSSYGYGAGIGGGLYGAGINILVENSTVAAYAYSGAAIGSGYSLGHYYNNGDTRSCNPELFITSEGAAPHASFPDGIKFATNIEIGGGSVITARSTNGAAIGSGAHNWGIGSGSSNKWCNMDVSVTDCDTLVITGVYFSGGALVGTGSGNFGGTATVAVTRCDEISGTIYSGTVLGTGSSNGLNNSNYGNSGQDVRMTTRFSMNVTDCGNIKMVGSTYSSASKTCIGSGPSNSYNEVDITVSDCGDISVDPYYYSVVGIGVGNSNQSNEVSVTVQRCGAINMGNTYSNFESSVGIGIGTGCCMSNLDYPTDYKVLVKDCESIDIKASGYYFTGIGSGSGTRSCTGTVTVENCGPVLVNQIYGYESVGIGTGRYSYWFNSSPAWREPTVNVQVKDCQDITVVMDGYRNVGIGMGYMSYYSKANVEVLDCGDVIVFHGYDPTFNTSNYSTTECVGIGMGRDNYNNDLNVTIARCGNVSTQYYTDDNGNPINSGNSTGIGSSYNCFSNNSGYTVDGVDEYFPTTLNIQIKDCQDVYANCGQNGVAIGTGYQNRDVTSVIDILDCASVKADGSYYGTGIGCGLDCYSNYSYINGADSTVNIRRCPGGVTAAGGRYGAAIGSGGNMRNNGAIVTVNIEDSGSVTATQKRLVADNTITDVNGSQRGHSAAIGSGWTNTGGAKVVINIDGCAITAEAEDSAAIGCGDRGNSNIVDLNFTNCSITAKGNNGGAGIGFGDTTTSSTVNLTLTNCDTGATSLAYGAGIGNGFSNSRSITNVEIMGGTVTATGKGGGAGIGGGPRGSVNRANVTIDNDAVVVATGSGACDAFLAEEDNPTGSDAGAGIGGTAGQYVGTIIINSGDVTAIGGGVEGYCAAGIGGGNAAKAGTVTINGGTVRATGGHCAECGAAGIGAGANSNAGTVTITGGDVTALGTHGEKMGGAGIGGGSRGDGGTIIIEGGTVVATGSERGAGLGGGFNGDGGDVTISGGTITVTGGLYDSAGIGGGANGEGGTLTLSGTPSLKVYGKSSNLAVTSAITTSVPFFQGTMAEVSDLESIISLIRQEEGGADIETAQDSVTLPATYDAFSLTLPMEGTYNAFLQADKRYLLSTTRDAVEDFKITVSQAVAGEQLNVVRFFDVVFQTGEGSPVPTQSVRINKMVEIPADPTRNGFLFGGWFTDEALTAPYDFSLPVTAAMNLYAKWIEVKGQPYMIYHYKESLEGGWDIGSIEYGGAKPNELVTAAPIEYEGFFEDKTNEDRVPSGTTAEGSTLILKLYYKRVTIQVDVENAGEDYPPQITAPYGTLVVLGKPTKEGYDFDQWTREDGSTIDATMPVKIETMGSVIFANWVLQEGRAAYQIKHYLRALNGNYSLRVAEDLVGEVGATVTVTPNNYVGYHVNHSISDETATGVVQADNSLALRVYYDRDIITVKLLDTYNTPESVSAEYGAAANLPTPSRAGYQFDGWQTADGKLVADGAKIETLGEAVTAQWSPAETTAYTVRYYKQSIDGKSYEIADLEDLQGATGSIVRAAIKEYVGFTYDAGSSTASGEVRADNRLILDLYYARNTYTITFDTDGGSTIAPLSGVLFQATAGAPKAPTKIGYDFAGWFSDEARDDLYNFGLPVTQDLTLYAKWDPRDDTAYKVVHYCQDVSGEGYTLTDTDDLTDTTDATVTAVAKTYTGFTEDLDHEGRVAEAAVAPDGSTVLRLYYKRDLHSVTFDSNGGTTVPKLAGIRYGAAIAAPTPPTRTGYTFLRWCGDEDCETAYDFAGAVTEDLTLYAQWEANSYSVTFNYQGAPFGGQPQVKGVDYGAAYGTLPVPAWAGYDFDGWFTHQEEGTEITADSVVATAEDHVLYARWTPHTDTHYIVRHYQQTVDGEAYDLADTDELTGTTGATATAVPNEYHGFTEDQRYSGRVPSGTIAGDGGLVLALYYGRNQHALIVDPANGQAVETIREYYGAAKTLPTEPRRSGYSFTGWTVVGVEVQEDGSYTMPDSDVSFTATWEAIDYSVSYRYTGTVPAGAPEPPEGGRSYNIGQVLEVAPVPTMPGYVLYGWTTEDVVVQRGQFIMPDSNVEFTGEWRKANYNVIYVYQGNVPEHAPAAPVDTRTYQVGDTVNVLPAPELAGYTFSGWTTSVEIIDGSFAMPTSNVVLRGSWTPITYSASYHYEGDVPSAPPVLPETTGYRLGDTVAVPPVAPVEGFIFQGWSLGDKTITEGAFPMPARDVEVIGTWARGSYPVSYRYEGKVPVKAPVPPAVAVHPYEAMVTVAARPQITGYLFSGWASTDVTPDPLGKFPMTAGLVSFSGTWSLVEYHITYELGGGIAAEDPAAYTIESPVITFDPPYREGYTFGGWFSDSSYTTQVTGIPAGSAGDFTLYAKWTANTPAPPPSGGGSSGGSASPTTYTLKFEVNGGSPVASITGAKNTMVKLVDHETTRPGFLFAGWYIDKQFNIKAQEEFKLAGDTTLYAKWDDLDAALNRAEHMAYIVGFNDGTIRPEANITRAEVAMIFYRLLTAEAHERYDTTENDFTDSADGDWYNTAVSTLAAMGVIQGRGTDRFDPSAPITRGEFAAIAARFDSEPYDGPDLFDDIAAHWAASEINRAARRGWVQGGGSGEFRPDALITRAEAITFINRVLGRSVTAEGLLEGHRDYPDNEPDEWYYYDMLEAAIGHEYHDAAGVEYWDRIG